MKHKNAVARYRYIDMRISMKQKPAPSLDEIVAFVSDKLGESVSTSSIQKDIYAMRYDERLGYFAPIQFDVYKKGYVYTEIGYSIQKINVSDEDLQGLELAVGILQQFQNIPAIKQFEDAIHKLAGAVKFSREQQHDKIVLLDRPIRYQGIEFMQDIVDAIRQKRVMKFMYLPFTKKEATKHTVHPYFIKEYNSRMYLIAKDIHPTKASKFLTFGFDRMQQLVVMHQTFQEELIDKESYFRSAIGISLPQTKPENIVLQFDISQLKYITSQPLHHSQKIIKEQSKLFTLQIHVVINYELMSLLLSFGDKLKVIKPASLVETMKSITKNLYQLYH